MSKQQHRNLYPAMVVENNSRILTDYISPEFAAKFLGYEVGLEVVHAMTHVTPSVRSDGDDEDNLDVL